MAKEAEDHVLFLKLFQRNFTLSWPHVSEVSPCTRFRKQNFVEPLLNCKSLSAVMFMFQSVLKSQGLYR